MSKTKKILIIAACVCLLTGCGDTGNQWEETTPTATPSTFQEETKASVSPDATETPMPTPTPIPVTATEKPEATPTPEFTAVPTATPEPEDDILEVSRVMYAVTPLNIRASNTTSSAIVGSFETNESVQVTGICDNGWARIDYNGSVAYVYYEYLSSEKTVATPTLTLTPIPSLTSLPVHVYDENLHAMGQSLYNQNLDIIQEHLACVNELRTSLGLNTLTLDKTVCNIASYRTAEMISLDYFSHYHPQNSNLACVFDIVYFYQDSYRQLAENIANIDGQWSYYFDRTATGGRTSLGEQLFNQFADSEGHYNNMVNPAYTKIGICVYVSDNYVLITQVFE